MILRTIKIYHGGNIYSGVPVICLRVDFGRLAEQPFDWLQGDIRARLDHHLPWIGKWVRDLERDRVNSPPPVAELAWRAAIALQHKPGNRYGFIRFGRAFDRGDGVFDVVYQYRFPEVGKNAGLMALGLIHLLAPSHLVAGDHSPHVFDFAGNSKDAVWQFQPRLPGIPTLRMLLEAERRGLPWRLTNNAIAEIGQGCFARQMVSTNIESLSWVGCRIVENKVTTIRELEHLGFPVPKQVTVKSSDEAIAQAALLEGPVVVKPVGGKAGRGISVNLTTDRQIYTAFLFARKFSRMVAIETFIPGDDHRLLVVGGRLIAAAKRLPAQVHGDGVKTIQKLIEDENKRRLHHRKSASYNLRVSNSVKNCLKRQRLTLDSVPNDGQVVLLSFVANYSQGGTTEDVTDLVHPDNRAMAVRAARVFGLDVAGVDFITPDITSSYRDIGGAICEVGARVGVFLHDRPDKGKKRNVAGPIMDMHFPQGRDGRIPVAAVTETDPGRQNAHALAHFLAVDGRTVGVAGKHDTVVAGLRQRIPNPVVGVIYDRRVDSAVISVTDQQLVEVGLGVESCEVGIISGNLSQDAVAIISRACSSLVLDLDSAEEWLTLCEIKTKELCLVSTDPDNKRLVAHVEAGKKAVVLNDQMQFMDSQNRVISFALEDFPASLGQSSLLAAAAAWLMGAERDVLLKGLATLTDKLLVCPARPEKLAALAQVNAVSDLDHPEVLWHGDELSKVTGGRWISGNGSQVAATGCLHVYPYFNRIREWLKPGDLATTTNPEQWGKKFNPGRRKSGAWPPLSQQVEYFFDNGAAAVMVHKAPDYLPPDKPVLLVDNTFDAFERLAFAARERFSGKVICVTGSVGKTSTRELIRHCLSRQGRTMATEKNRNILTGIKGSLAKTPANFDFGIYEVSHPLTVKARIARPHVGIITEIQPDHLEFIHTLESIAEGKSELFENLDVGGTAIINRDSPFFHRMKKIATSRDDVQVATFGVHEQADARLLSVDLSLSGSEVRACIHGVMFSYNIPLPGRHMVMNTLAALLAIHAAGGDWQQAARDIAHMEALPNRIERERIPYQGDYVELINDGYSVNPASLKAGLSVVALAEPVKNGRRIAVLGEMLELGRNGPRLHADIASHVVAAGIDKVYSFGTLMRFLQEALPPEKRAFHSDEPNDVAAALLADLRPNDIVFIKGSNRTTHLTTRIINSLKSSEAFSGERPETAVFAVAAVDKRVVTRDVVKADLTIDKTRAVNRFDIAFAGEISFDAQSKSICGDLGKLLNRNDLAVVNLLGTITSSSESPLQGIKNKIYRNSPDVARELIEELNVGLVGLGNNHAMDFGPGGLEEMLLFLEQQGVRVCGAGRSYAEAVRPFVGQVDIGPQKFRFAVFSALQTHDKHRRMFQSYAGEKKPGVARLVTRRLAERISALKKSEPDIFVVVLPHWIISNRWKSRSETEKIDILIEAGANLVLGTGSPYWKEVDKRSGCWVLYGVGEVKAMKRDQKVELPYSFVVQLSVLSDGVNLQPGLTLYPRIQCPLTAKSRGLNEKEFSDFSDQLCQVAPDPYLWITQSEPGRDDCGYFWRLPI